MIKQILRSILGLCVIAGCAGKGKENSAQNMNNPPRSIFSTDEEKKQYVEELLSFRKEKDMFFQESPDSPLKPSDKKVFHGLKYFDVNPEFVVKAKLHRHSNPQRVKITTTTGTEREAIIYGHFEFFVKGQQLKLNVYKFIDQQDDMLKTYLFIPFTDATSGKITYGAGRYLDLEEHATDDEYILDFNRAYNPYCAYNDNYSCPIPPRENRLSLASEAGEKSFH